MTINKKQFDSNSRGILNGVRVLDLSRLVSGNTLTMLLADYGAEVLKLEPIQGDALRKWVKGGVSTDWKCLGRNKKSIGLNLRSEEGKALFRKLVAKSQVLVENYRSGTLEEMGFSPEVLHQINPKLVIARITGFGQKGPYKNRPGFGTLVEGMCGMAQLQGFPDRAPVMPPGPIADTFAGFSGAMSVLLALREVEINQGKGQVIDQSLFTPLFMAMGAQATDYRATGILRKRDSNKNIFQTGDGKYVTCSMSMDPMPQRVLSAIGKDAYNHIKDYQGVAGLTRHRDEIRGWMQEFIGKMTQAEAVEYFVSREISLAPVFDISQIMDDAHFQEVETVVELPDPEMGHVPMYGFPSALSETPGNFFRPAPSIGEHNEELMEMLGLDESELAALETAGVLHHGNGAKPENFSYQ